MEAGSLIWVNISKLSLPDNFLLPKHVSWLRAVVTHRSMDCNYRTIQFRIEDNNSSINIDSQQLLEVRVALEEVETDIIKLRSLENNSLERKFLSIKDLTEIQFLNEPSILETLKLRYESDKIYVSCGETLLAINPFKNLPIYSKKMIEMYYNHGLLTSQSLANSFGDDIEELPPHVFKVADLAYRQMLDSAFSSEKGPHVKMDQSILVSGESGSGKTETTKFLMEYLATVGGSKVTKGAGYHTREAGANSVTAGILNSSPILEAFGNACTLRNQNSSRFGKFAQITFTRNGHISSGSISTYLLERVRVITHESGEQNFHIFYQLLAGWKNSSFMSDEFVTLEGKKVCDFEYLNPHMSNGESERCINPFITSKAFDQTVSSMKGVGVSTIQIKNVMKIVAGILFLGNVQFASEGEGSFIESSNNEEIDSFTVACSFMGLNPSKFSKILLTRSISVHNKEEITKRNTVKECEQVRDAISKYLYSKLFEWVVQGINRSIRDQESHIGDSLLASINILDIFGFENFPRNSLEQLCINYTNEKLQAFFHMHTMEMKRILYQSEILADWEESDSNSIAATTTKTCIGIFEAHPIGLLSLLDDEIHVPRGNDDSLARKIQSLLDKSEPQHISRKKRSFVNDRTFSIEHFAGTVQYFIEGFCDKNKDFLPRSAHDFFTYEFENESLSHKALPMLLCEAEIHSYRDQQSSSLKLQKSLTSSFRKQLAQLLETIQDTQPHFIRCFKPNGENLPSLFDRVKVLEQLQHNGVSEAVQAAQKGFSVKFTHQDFTLRYCSLVRYEPFHRNISGTNPMGFSHHPELRSDDQVKCFGFLCNWIWHQDVKLLAMGKTLVFLKKRAHDLIEMALQRQKHQSSIVIQRNFLRYYYTTKYNQLLLATLVVQRGIRFFLSKRIHEKKVYRKLCVKIVGIQKIFRGFTSRKKYQARRHAAIILQRAFLARRKLRRNAVSKKAPEIRSCCKQQDPTSKNSTSTQDALDFQAEAIRSLHQEVQKLNREKRILLAELEDCKSELNDLRIFRNQVLDTEPQSCSNDRNTNVYAPANENDSKRSRKSTVQISPEELQEILLLDQSWKKRDSDHRMTNESEKVYDVLAKHEKSFDELKRSLLKGFPIRDPQTGRDKYFRVRMESCNPAATSMGSSHSLEEFNGPSFDYFIDILPSFISPRVLHTVPLSEIEEISTRSTCPDSNQQRENFDRSNKQGRFFLSILTNDATKASCARSTTGGECVSFFTETLEDQCAIATGLKTLLADISLRQPPPNPFQAASLTPDFARKVLWEKSQHNAAQNRRLSFRTKGNSEPVSQSKSIEDATTAGAGISLTSKASSLSLAAFRRASARRFLSKKKKVQGKNAVPPASIELENQRLRTVVADLRKYLSDQEKLNNQQSELKLALGKQLQQVLIDKEDLKESNAQLRRELLNGQENNFFA